MITGVEIMRHATGDNSGNRNNYCVHDGHKGCESLVERGLMARGRLLNRGRDRIYYVTENGRVGVRLAIQAERNRLGLRLWCVERKDAGLMEQGQQIWAKSRSAARWAVVGDLLDLYEREHIPMLLKAYRVRLAR